MIDYEGLKIEFHCGRGSMKGLTCFSVAHPSLKETTIGYYVNKTTLLVVESAEDSWVTTASIGSVLECFLDSLTSNDEDLTLTQTLKKGIHR